MAVGGPLGRCARSANSSLSRSSRYFGPERVLGARGSWRGRGGPAATTCVRQVVSAPDELTRMLLHVHANLQILPVTRPGERAPAPAANPRRLDSLEPVPRADLRTDQRKDWSVMPIGDTTVTITGNLWPPTRSCATPIADMWCSPSPPPPRLRPGLEPVGRQRPPVSGLLCLAAPGRASDRIGGQGHAGDRDRAAQAT